MRATKRALRPQPLPLLIVLSIPLLVVLGPTVEASWKPLTGQPDLLAVHASPVGEVIKGSVGQFLSLMMMAVAVVVGVPLFIAGLAFSASYIVSRIGGRLRKRHHIVTAKASTISS